MNLIVEIGLATMMVVGLGGGAFAIHKLRRIHTMMFAVATKDDVQQIYRQVEALQFLYRELTMEQSLPPLRGYAASPDFLREIVRAVRGSRPQVVVELGSGASTIVTARALELNRGGHLYSLEHDAEYAAKTRTLIREHGLEGWVTVINAPLTDQVVRGENHRWYSLDQLADVNIDVLVVDGPPAATQRHARYPALPLLRSRLSDRGVVIVDDTARRDDAEVVARWSREFPDLVFSARDCEKGCMRIESVSVHGGNQAQSVADVVGNTAAWQRAGGV